MMRKYNHKQQFFPDAVDLKDIDSFNSCSDGFQEVLQKHLENMSEKVETKKISVFIDDCILFVKTNFFGKEIVDIPNSEMEKICAYLSFIAPELTSTLTNYIDEDGNIKEETIIDIITQIEKTYGE